MKPNLEAETTCADAAGSMRVAPVIPGTWPGLEGAVGVVVPNYDYARYLPGRLLSILAQGRAVGQLVFLDDASSDDSIAVAGPLLARFPCPVAIARSEVNGGSVFRQWARGLERIETPFVWIAEADDGAETELLNALAPRLANDPSSLFAFSDSAAIGADDAVVAATTKTHAASMGDPVLDDDATLEAAEFIRRCLCPRNLVVSASAVLWRTDVLRAALRRVGDEIDRWRCAGDWRIYAEATVAGGTVHYDARPLNRHRRHADSVTGSLPRALHFAEVVSMHATLRRMLDRERAQDERMRQHLSDLRRAWALA